jgi:hypothetical protein
MDPHNQNNIDIQMRLNLFQHINLDYHKDFLGKYLIDKRKWKKTNIIIKIRYLYQDVFHIKLRWN